MNQHFVEILNRKFTNQFMIEANERKPFIRFPAKDSDFGDISIYEDSPGQYIVEVGKFTHIHFDQEKTEEVAEDVCDFLVKLFADCIICWGAHESGGGCFFKEDEGEEDIDWTDLFIWSGLYKKAPQQ